MYIDVIFVSIHYSEPGVLHPRKEKVPFQSGTFSADGSTRSSQSKLNPETRPLKKKIDAKHGHGENKLERLKENGAEPVHLDENLGACVFFFFSFFLMTASGQHASACPRSSGRRSAHIAQHRRPQTHERSIANEERAAFRNNSYGPGNG